MVTLVLAGTPVTVPFEILSLPKKQVSFMNMKNWQTADWTLRHSLRQSRSVAGSLIQKY